MVNNARVPSVKQRSRMSFQQHFVWHIESHALVKSNDKVYNGMLKDERNHTIVRSGPDHRAPVPWPHWGCFLFWGADMNTHFPAYVLYSNSTPRGSIRTGIIKMLNVSNSRIHFSKSHLFFTQTFPLVNYPIADMLPTVVTLLTA